MTDISLSTLESLVAGDGVAIRVRQQLQPAGGPGDKIFPPTYATGDGKLKYAGETRRVSGHDVPCVLLDSVASQANRMEEALLAAWELEALNFPVIGVDFSGEGDLADLGSVTTLQAPHRIADAILRDATTAKGDILFRDTPQGKAYTESLTSTNISIFKTTRFRFFKTLRYTNSYSSGLYEYQSTSPAYPSFKATSLNSLYKTITT